MNEVKLYSKYNSLQKNDAKYVIDRYLRLLNLDKDEKILDVGTGDGEVLNEYLIPKLPNFVKIIGVDISKQMIRFAREKYPKINYDIMDIATDSIPIDYEENFNHIFSFYCLHWVNKQKKTFKNLYKMLKPGGEILLTFLASNPIYDIYENMVKTKWGKYMLNLDEYISPYHHNPMPEKQLQDILKEVGFSSLLCRVEERFYTFPSFSILEKTVLAVNPFISGIPENERNNYISDYLDEVRKLKTVEIKLCKNNNEEKITVPYKLFIVIASKPKKECNR